MGKFLQLFCLPRRHVGNSNFGTSEFANSIRAFSWCRARATVRKRAPWSRGRKGHAQERRRGGAPTQRVLSDPWRPRRCYRVVVTQYALIIAECAPGGGTVITESAPAAARVIAPSRVAYRAVTNMYAKHTGRLQERLDVYWIVHNFVRVHFTTRQVPAVALGILDHGFALHELFLIQKTA